MGKFGKKELIYYNLGVNKIYIDYNHKIIRKIMHYNKRWYIRWDGPNNWYWYIKKGQAKYFNEIY